MIWSTYESPWPPDITSMKPGDYMLIPEGGGHPRQLWFRDPFGDVGRCVHHTITENADGTITVDPSIASEPGGFHGWLKDSVWTW